MTKGKFSQLSHYEYEDPVPRTYLLKIRQQLVSVIRSSAHVHFCLRLRTDTLLITKQGGIRTRTHSKL
jgi:hypothetical protein